MVDQSKKGQTGSNFNQTTPEIDEKKIQNLINLIDRILDKKEIQTLINPFNDPVKKDKQKQAIVDQTEKLKKLQQLLRELEKSHKEATTMQAALMEELRQPTGLSRLLADSTGHFTSMGVITFFLVWAFVLRQLFLASSIELLKLKAKIIDKQIKNIHSFDTNVQDKSEQLLRHIQNLVAKSPVLSQKESERFEQLLTQWWNSQEGKYFLSKKIADPQHLYKILPDDKIKLSFSELVDNMIRFYRANNDIEAQRFLTTLKIKHKIYYQALENYEKELASKQEFSSFYEPVIHAMSKVRESLQYYFTDTEICPFIENGKEINKPWKAWLELEQQYPFGMIVYPNILEKVREKVERMRTDFQNQEDEYTLIDFDMLTPKMSEEKLANCDISEINFFEKNYRLMISTAEPTLSFVQDLFKTQQARQTVQNLLKNFGKKQKETNKQDKTQEQSQPTLPQNDFDYPII